MAEAWRRQWSSTAKPSHGSARGTLLLLPMAGWGDNRYLMVLRKHRHQGATPTASKTMRACLDVGPGVASPPRPALFIKRLGRSSIFQPLLWCARLLPWPSHRDQASISHCRGATRPTCPTSKGASLQLLPYRYAFVARTRRDGPSSLARVYRSPPCPPD